MRLTAENVHDTMSACLYDDPSIKTEADLPADALRVEGIVRNFALDPKRVAAHKDAIRSMVEELPASFHAKSGGGWSFLNACMLETGEQWGEQSSVEALYVLGQAAGFVKCLLPRDTWPLLPGGVPYFVVNVEA